MGAPAKPLRMALGSLIIKERCGFTDEEIVNQIQENPYLQYFIDIDHIEQYKERYGCYPEAIQVDNIYRTRHNIAFCKEHGIRISGPTLGRSPKTVKPTEGLKEEKQDLRERIAIEGKIEEGKRHYGLSRKMAKIPKTNEAVIGIIILMMNLERKLRLLFTQILLRQFKLYKWLRLAV